MIFDIASIITATNITTTTIAMIFNTNSIIAIVIFNTIITITQRHALLYLETLYQGHWISISLHLNFVRSSSGVQNVGNKCSGRLDDH